MSRWGKVSWLVFCLSVVILFAVRFILGGWNNYLFVPLALTFVGFIGALSFDYKLYLEFLTMRTTKHGMNMGLMILLVLVMLVSVNFLGSRYNKTFDLTEEKLHSLSEQSVDVLKALTKDIQLMVFYRGADDQDAKTGVKEFLRRYKENSKKVKVTYVNAYIDHAKAKEYLKDVGNPNQMHVFVEYEGRKVKVETPFDEEKFTSAMVKATRKNPKKVYFLTGHGERDMDGQDESGIKSFKQAV